MIHHLSDSQAPCNHKDFLRASVSDCKILCFEIRRQPDLFRFSQLDLHLVRPSGFQITWPFQIASGFYRQVGPTQPQQKLGKAAPGVRFVAGTSTSASIVTSWPHLQVVEISGECCCPLAAQWAPPRFAESSCFFLFVSPQPVEDWSYKGLCLASSRWLRIGAIMSWCLWTPGSQLNGDSCGNMSVFRVNGHRILASVAQIRSELAKAWKTTANLFGCNSLHPPN